jgi:hypothetical protein
MHEASLWTSTGDTVDCQLCNHFCKIREGRKGLCQVRKNVGGQLLSLNYGKLIAAHIDPIERNRFSIFTRKLQLLHRGYRLQSTLFVVPELGHLSIFESYDRIDWL